MNSKLMTMLAAVLVAVAMPVAAHHSFSAEFDRNKPVELEGVVKKMEWVNPHTWLHIEVVNAKGETEEWAIEGGAPAVLLRLGWTKESLLPGTRVKVKGSQSKDGALRASSSGIEFPDGRTLQTGGSDAREGRN